MVVVTCQASSLKKIAYNFIDHLIRVTIEDCTYLIKANKARIIHIWKETNKCANVFVNGIKKIY